jgi:hypothetical protein
MKCKSISKLTCHMLDFLDRFGSSNFYVTTSVECPNIAGIRDVTELLQQVNTEECRRSRDLPPESREGCQGYHPRSHVAVSHDGHDT